MSIAVIGGWIFNRAAAWVILKLPFCVALSEKVIAIRNSIITPSELQYFSLSCLKALALPFVKGVIRSALNKKTINSIYVIQKYNSEIALNLDSVYRDKAISIPRLRSEITGLAE